MEDAYRIYTNPNTTLILYKFDNISQVFELATNDVALSSHILQHSYNGARRLVCLVKLRRYPTDSRRSRIAIGVPRMEVIQLDAKRLAAFQIIQKRGIRLIGLLFFRLGKIHEIGAVRKTMLVDFKVVLF